MTWFLRSYTVVTLVFFVLIYAHFNLMIVIYRLQEMDKAARFLFFNPPIDWDLLADVEEIIS